MDSLKLKKSWKACKLTTRWQHWQQLQRTDNLAQINLPLKLFRFYSLTRFHHFKIIPRIHKINELLCHTERTGKQTINGVRRNRPPLPTSFPAPPSPGFRGRRKKPGNEVIWRKWLRCFLGCCIFGVDVAVCTVERTCFQEVISISQNYLIKGSLEVWEKISKTILQLQRRQTTPWRLVLP